MNKTTAQRVIVGSMVLVAVTSAADHLADEPPNAEGSTPPSPRILIGSMIAGAGLLVLAEGAPDIAAGIAALAVLGRLLASGGLITQLAAAIGGTPKPLTSTRK